MECFSCQGTLCSTSETFVAVDDKQQVVLYHLSSCWWSLRMLKGVHSVSSIHRDTGFVVGGHGVAQRIDIPLFLVTQVLWQGLSRWFYLCLTSYTLPLDSWPEKELATLVRFLSHLWIGVTHTLLPRRFKTKQKMNSWLQLHVVPHVQYGKQRLSTSRMVRELQVWMIGNILLYLMYSPWWHVDCFQAMRNKNEKKYQCKETRPQHSVTCPCL